jgi:hypothetical protein
MKRVEHLEDSFGQVLFDGDAGAKGPGVRRRVENNSGEISVCQTLVQRLAHLAHHGDVKDVEWRPRESDAGDPLVNREPDVLKFFRHSL